MTATDPKEPFGVHQNWVLSGVPCATTNWLGVMKRIVEICLCLMVMQSGMAEDLTDCSDRFEYRAIPEFPTSLKATHALLAGRCTINVTFDLLESGEPENLTARAPEDRCNGFEKSAMRSILLSNFKAGARIQGCKILVSYEYEDDSE